MIEYVTRTVLRELANLERQVTLYPDEASLWKQVPGLPNAGGTLALHLVGNLRHFIGAQLGGTGYVRDREAEFAARDVPRSELLELIRAARHEVAATLEALDPAALVAEYPIRFGDKALPSGLFVAHLAAHLAYHLGQLDYHRRVTTGQNVSAGALSIPALSEKV